MSGRRAPLPPGMVESYGCPFEVLPKNTHVFLHTVLSPNCSTG